MKRLSYLLTSVLASTLFGCGGGSTMMTQPPPPPPGMNGNFGMAAVATGPDSFQIGGLFQSTAGGMVSGTVRVDSATSTCFDFFAPLTFSGTMSSGGQFSLTSSVYDLQTITISGMLSSDGKTITSGSFSIAGGCGTGIHGSITGFQLPMVNGTYTGSFMAGGATIGVSVKISQSAPPNTFGLSGNATFTNSGTCSLSSANILAFETGFIAGSDVRAGMLDPTITPVANFTGVFGDGTAKTIRGTISLPNGPCAGTSVPIVLTMP